MVDICLEAPNFQPSRRRAPPGEAKTELPCPKKNEMLIFVPSLGAPQYGTG